MTRGVEWAIGVSRRPADNTVGRSTNCKSLGFYDGDHNPSLTPM